MKVIFLAYRDWSLKVLPTIERHPKISKVTVCTAIDEVSKLNLSEYDLLVTCGISDELGNDITSKIIAIGVHCAELDRYSYGTPLQLQIIDGVTSSKHRIFSFTYDEKSDRAHTHNRLYSHEVDLDLSGNMDDILEQMTCTSKVLFTRYLNDYPNVNWKTWPEESIRRDKRLPEDSKLSKDQIANMNTEQLYNFFRCLESPYPNGYIEDVTGKLYIQRVMFKKH